MAEVQLDTPVQYVKGVGPVRAEQLAALGIATVEDLLLYFPRRFDLRRQVQPIQTLRSDEPNATVAGTVEAVSENRFSQRPSFQCTLDDGTGFVLCKWFHAPYLRDAIKPGLVLAVSGKVSVYKETLQFIHPMHQVLYDADGKDLSKDELLPVYPAGGKLTSGIIARIVQKVLPQAGGLVRAWFDEAYLEKRGLMSRGRAVVAMHRPDDKDQWSAARRRCAYDECFLMQLGIAMARLRAVSRPAWPLANTPEIDRRIRARFPFPMTDAQDRVVAEIVADLAGENPANRLIQGDVGSGKTVVALYAALLAVANGKQAAPQLPRRQPCADRTARGRTGRRPPPRRARRARRRVGQPRRRHARPAGRGRPIRQPGPGGRRRAAQVRRAPAHRHPRQGLRAALSGHDGHADPADPRHDGLRRPGRLDDRRTPARAWKDPHSVHRHGPAR
ncbi:MAG: OB-fold nucleic acid binding domain-containing protein [Planctomycetota bacterium]|nr:OB-fold nucleic acid binding domain-containing protein [Planctomycetota bacterium]